MGMAIPGQDHDTVLPRPTFEGLYGTIWCSTCGFSGVGRDHPEWCTWQGLKRDDRRARSLDLLELGDRASGLLRPGTS